MHSIVDVSCSFRLLPTHNDGADVMVGPEVQARIEEVLRRFDSDEEPKQAVDELPLSSATILKFPRQGVSPIEPHGSGRRPLLLDLFCCAGGAGVGYHRAGFDVVGVDIVPRPNYPLAFIQADAMILDPKFIALFDAVHASPPCQSYSDLAKRNRNGEDWPRLVEPVREMLRRTGKPYVIENVEGAPLENPVVLCGTMFPGLRVLRHRLFEANFPIETPPHRKHPKVHTFDKRKSHFGKTDEWKDFVQVTGGGNCSLAAARDAMGIDWMTKGEINEAIPPAYAELIGRQLLSHMSTAQTMPTSESAMGG